QIAAGWEAMGTTVVPYLLSGRFHAVLNENFVDQLKTYTGVPPRNVLPAELLEREALKLAAYEPVPIPLILLAARVQGDVRLRLQVDDRTGETTGADVLSRPWGPGTLDQPILEHVRRWRFEPGSVPEGRVDVTLRFEPRCGT